MADLTTFLTESVKPLVETHNASAATKKVDYDAFVVALADLGATDLETLSQVEVPDLTTAGLPLLIARKVKAALTANTAPVTVVPEKKGDANEAGATTTAKGFMKKKDAQAATARVLVENYDPSTKSSPVHEELRARSNGKPFILFDANSAVVVDVTAKLLQELVDGREPREMYNHGGKPEPLYIVGARPDLLFDQNPLLPSLTLDADGKDTKFGYDWTPVPLNVRQLLYLAAVETREARVTDDKYHDLFDLAVKEGAEMKIRTRFPLASRSFDEKAKHGGLPLLKVSPNTAGTTGGSNPFGHKTW